MRAFIFAVCAVVLAGQSSAREGATNRDSTAVPLADVPLDIQLAHLGDSLFSPPVGKARILRDDYGVPHVYANTDVDVAFGFGYAQAEDHLLQMAMNFRQAKGRLAEVKGASALKSDETALSWRVHDVAAERYGDLSEETRRYIEAFAAGINHYIAIHREVLPQWIEDVRAVDVVALSRWLLFLFAEQTGEPELSLKGLTPAVPKLPGSNQWVIGPSRSQTAAPALAVDVQLPYSAPFRLCEAHLVSGEGLNVAGATFFGLPVIFVGNNSRIAWSLTPNDLDAFDLYEERLDPANRRRYLYGDEKRRVVSRQVKIGVQSDDGLREVERELRHTHHGPIYKMTEHWAYSARVSTADRVDGIGQLLAMNRADTPAEFQDALSRLELPAFHVMYGDVTGEIFYVFYGRCPVRSEAFDWRAPVPGWTPETEWRGVLAFSELPQVRNPASGFLQNCDVAPNLVTTDSGLERDAFPPFLGWGGNTHRAQWVASWLLSHQNIAESEMRALLRDDYIADADAHKGLIFRAYNRAWPALYDPKGHVAAAVQLLRSWDNRAGLDSVGALLFFHWKARYDPLLARVSQKRDGLVREQIALDALQRAVAYMTATYGRIDVPWGQVHRLERGDRAFSMGGAPSVAEALHQTRTRTKDDGTWSIQGGSAFAMVVSLVQPVQAWSALAHGNSENPASSHYADQVDLQRRGTLKQTVFAPGDLQSALTGIATVPHDSTERR